MLKVGEVNSLLLKLTAIVVRQTAVGHARNAAIFVTRVNLLHKELFDGDFLAQMYVLGKVGNAECALSKDTLYPVCPLAQKGAC